MPHAAPSYSELAELCHTLRQYLGAGLTLVQALQNQAKRGPAAVRELAADLVARLGEGDTLEDAVRAHPELPPLFVETAAVAEQSGAMPEIFRELERYYVLRDRLRKQFRTKMIGPVVQLVVGVLVVTAVILILGSLGSNFDPVGLGVTGPKGALLFLGIVAALLGGTAGVVLVLRRKAAADAWLMRQPVVGPAVQALALHRFCVALRLTAGTGMPISHAVRLALRATGLSAFAAAADPVCKRLDRGDDLARALSKGGVFPREFLGVLRGAELAGRLDDVLEHQAGVYEEESGRRLAALATAAAWGVRAFVGLLLVFLILRMGMSYVKVVGG